MFWKNSKYNGYINKEMTVLKAFQFVILDSSNWSNTNLVFNQNLFLWFLWFETRISRHCVSRLGLVSVLRKRRLFPNRLDFSKRAETRPRWDRVSCPALTTFLLLEMSNFYVIYFMIVIIGKFYNFFWWQWDQIHL